MDIKSALPMGTIVRGPEGATVHPPSDPPSWVSFCSLVSLVSEKRMFPGINSFRLCFLSHFLNLCQNPVFSNHDPFLRVGHFETFHIGDISTKIWLFSLKFLAYSLHVIT